MRNKLSILLILGGATLSAAAFAGNARELLFSAPIQQLDRALGTVTVLGQTFHAGTDQLSIGQVVNVYGVLNKDGTTSDTVVNATTTYGANGDPVFLKGVVTDVDASLGRVRLDGMSVDYTSQLSNPGFTQPSAGDVIAIAASQPAQRGTLIAIATGAQAYETGTSASNVTGVAGVAVSTANSTTTAGLSSGMSVSAGLTGGGNRSAGLTGGGNRSAGLTGGGNRSAGLTGGGDRSAGLTGGGDRSAGLTGGGDRSAGLTGGGDRSAGLTGGGIRAAGLTGGGRL